jgi:DNA-binding transcriptional MerR regulator
MMAGMTQMPATKPVAAKLHDGAHIDRPDLLQREQFTISDLSAEFGVTARALRFYEDEGLIAPARIGLTRIYSKRDRARLAWIIRAKNVGFSLTEIKELIDLYDLDDGRVTQKERTIQRCREQVAKLSKQRDDIDAAIADLSGFINELETLELPVKRS